MRLELVENKCLYSFGSEIFKKREHFEVREKKFGRWQLIRILVKQVARSGPCPEAKSDIY
jgi:hypothetical protein